MENFNLYSYCIDCDFNKCETKYKEELNDLLKTSELHIKHCCFIFEV